MTTNTAGANNSFVANNHRLDDPKNVFNDIYHESHSSPAPFNALATIGWTNIMFQLIASKNELTHFSSGEMLSTFAIDYINKVSNSKLQLTILEQGTECLKQFTEITINRVSDVPETQKMSQKEWCKLFLDIWKEQTKEDLKKQNLLIE